VSGGWHGRIERRAKGDGWGFWIFVAFVVLSLLIKALLEEFS